MQTGGRQRLRILAEKMAFQQSRRRRSPKCDGAATIYDLYKQLIYTPRRARIGRRRAVVSIGDVGRNMSVNAGGGT